MRWSDERFVKVYTRDTPDLLALGWEARALLWELLRKVDRAGIFELGKSGNRGLAVVTGIPVEVVDRALPILIQDGCVESHGRHLLVRSFIEAQEAKQSDKARQQKCRESDRDKARRDSALQSHGVTEEAKPSRNDVTPRDENRESVTATASDVTLRLEETIQTRNSLPRDPSAGTTEPATEPKTKLPSAHDWLFLFGVRWKQKLNGKEYGQGESDAKACGRFGELLASFPDSQRLEDWAARERVISEFLSSTDKATVAAGWPFSFFTAAFRGLTIPPALRPKADQRNGKPAPAQARY